MRQRSPAVVTAPEQQKTVEGNFFYATHGDLHRYKGRGKRPGSEKDKKKVEPNNYR